jgi:hypothetical protein
MRGIIIRGLIGGIILEFISFVILLAVLSDFDFDGHSRPPSAIRKIVVGLHYPGTLAIDLTNTAGSVPGFVIGIGVQILLWSMPVMAGFGMARYFSNKKRATVESA